MLTGRMSKTGVALLCLVLVLTTFVQLGWGSRNIGDQQSGSMSTQNTGQYDQKVMFITHFSDGTEHQSDYIPLAPGATVPTAIVEGA